MATINRQRILTHMLLWTGVWLLLNYIFSNGFAERKILYYRTLPLILSIMIVISVNLSILLSRFYFKKQIVRYLLWSVVLFIGVIWLMGHNFFLFSSTSEAFLQFEEVLRQKQQNWQTRPSAQTAQRIRYIVPLLITFVGSTMVELTQYANQKERRLTSIEKEKLDTEIKFLKSQINPHFLFNVLNNIYTLTVIKSDKASDNLLRLSDMLRYMLYDSNENRVSLIKEINYLESYIKLSELKDSRGLRVNVYLDKSQPHLKVAPLIFIPFVENAYKHSKIEDIENGFINIDLSLIDDEINFKVENSIPHVQFKKDKVGGIGLANTKQRLQLLYPNAHQLHISHSDGKYVVQLKLENL